MREVKILLSDNFTTRFMQHADMFERFKVAVKPLLKATVVDDFGEKNIEAMQKRMKDAPYTLVAVFDKDTIYYRNPDVKVVSTGTQWCLLDDFLRESAKDNVTVSEVVVSNPHEP